jgi:tetratricopeptide (TPR) repeat protein
MSILQEGNRLLAKGELQMAEASFREALRQQPDSLAAARGLAKALARLNRYEEILVELAEIARRLASPSLLRHVGDAARVLTFRGQKKYLEDAIDFYKNLLAMQVDSVAAFYLGELLSVEAGKPTEALAAYRLAWAQNERSTEFREAVAQCLRLLGRLEDANRVLEGEEPRW